MKKVGVILSALVLLVLVAGGSFYGGMLYQTQQLADTRVRFFDGRGGTPVPGGGGGLGFGGGGNGAGFPGGAGRGTFGQIKSIEGNTLVISSPQSEVKVTLTDNTQFLKVVDGALSDLKVGDQVNVRGETDANGNVTANTVQLTLPFTTTAP